MPARALLNTSPRARCLGGHKSSRASPGRALQEACEGQEALDLDPVLHENELGLLLLPEVLTVSPRTYPSISHTMLALSIKCPELAAAFSANAGSSAKHSMQCKGCAGPGHLHSMLSADY
jgi:hypothetical protein